MADKSDNLSKHLATKRTRRGALKFIAAGIIGTTVGAFVSREAADAWGGRRNPRNPRTGRDVQTIS